MKIGYDTKRQEFYVAEYDRKKGKVVVRETNTDFDALALKYNFLVEEKETKNG